MGHGEHDWGSMTVGRAAPGCSQPNLTLSHQQQHQHGASRNGIRERKIHFNPLGPAAGLDPAGQWGSGGCVLPREVQLGRNPPGCCCPAPSGHTLQGKEVGFAEIMDEKGHTSPALLCWPLCFLSFPRTWNSSLDFMPPLHCCLQWLGFSQHAFPRARVLGTIYF